MQVFTAIESFKLGHLIEAERLYGSEGNAKDGIKKLSVWSNALESE